MKNNNLIRGIGNDLIEMDRFRRSLERKGNSLLERIFTEKERIYCERFPDPVIHFAGRFAAKEALSKALGSGIGARLSWQDLEILNDESGKPCVYPSPSLEKWLSESTLLVSISHTDSYATAVALWVSS